MMENPPGLSSANNPKLTAEPEKALNVMSSLGSLFSAGPSKRYFDDSNGSESDLVKSRV